MGPPPLRGANSSLWTLGERKSLSFAMCPPVSGGSVDMIMIRWTASNPCPRQQPWLNPVGSQYKNKNNQKVRKWDRNLVEDGR